MANVEVLKESKQMISTPLPATSGSNLAREMNNGNENQLVSGQSPALRSHIIGLVRGDLDREFRVFIR